MAKRAIGIDIGGTKIAAGIVVNSRIVDYVEVPTPKTRKKFLKRLFGVIDKIIDKNVNAIGIGFPAPVVEGIVLEVQNIPSLKNTNLKKIIEKKYKVKCVVDNDANAFALAEQRFGAAKGKKHVVGITLGTGLGCGIIIGGKVYSGNTGAAGEISRVPHDRATLEDFANIRFLKKISGKDPLELDELAKKGNKKALKAWETYGKHLGKVLAVVVDTLDPEVIVLGGRISRAYPFFRKNLNPKIRKYCFKHTASKVKIVKSNLKNSGVVGAACLIDSR